MRLMILLALLLVSGSLSAQTQGAIKRVRHVSRFELAVACIKKYEGLHGPKHHPYVGYGHKLLPGEKFSPRMTERQADATVRPFAGEGTGLNAGKSLPILCNTVGISVTPYSFCARSMILPPVPSPKSCHRFKERLTLNDGVRSCLKGERYHTLSPCLLTGENPARPRKSSSGIFFTSSMFIACLFYRLFKRRP